MDRCRSQDKPSYDDQVKDGRRRPHGRVGLVVSRLVGVLAVCWMVVCAPLSMAAFLGIFFLPLTVLGGLMLALAVACAPRAYAPSRLRTLVVWILALSGATILVLFSWISAEFAWRQLIAADRPGATVSLAVSSAESALSMLACLLAPSLVTLAVRLRTKASQEVLVGWWLLTAACQPAAFLCMKWFAAMGLPISA